MLETSSPLLCTRYSIGASVGAGVSSMMIGMRVETDQPAVQLYCGGGLGGIRGKGGKIYQPFAGFCLETQHFPDSPNHPDFPGTVLRAGEIFKSRTKFSFYVE